MKHTDNPVNWPSVYVAIENMDEARETLCLVSQLLAGWSQDGSAWSEHDENVRQRVLKLQRQFES